MTNYEFLKKYPLYTEELNDTRYKWKILTSTNLPTKCDDNCRNCRLASNPLSCILNLIDWLNEEHLPIDLLNDEEKYLILSLKEGTLYRDAESNLIYKRDTSPNAKEVDITFLSPGIYFDNLQEHSSINIASYYKIIKDSIND